MNKYNFSNLQEVVSEINNRNFDRNFTSILGESFFSEENKDFHFDYNNFKALNFLFHFFNVEQYDLSENEFKQVILNLLKLDDENNIIRIKEIIYQKQLDMLKDKFKKALITKEKYYDLRSKYLE